MQLKRHRYRSVKNYWKANKIHSSGDIWPEHEKGKVRKTDECISELYGELFWMRTLVNGVEMPFTGVFGISYIKTWEEIRDNVIDGLVI